MIAAERGGKYRMLMRGGNPAFCMSNTSVLNAFERECVTWQPEAYVRFGSTLSGGTSTQAAERAFETLVGSIAQSGFSLIDERTCAGVSGRVDRARCRIYGKSRGGSAKTRPTCSFATRSNYHRRTRSLRRLPACRRGRPATGRGRCRAASRWLVPALGCRGARCRR